LGTGTTGTGSTWEGKEVKKMRAVRLRSPDEHGGVGGEGAEQGEQGNQPADAQGEALARAVARYREVVASGPDLVPELVRGDTIEEVDASVTAARQAYSNLSQRIAQAHEAHVPTGNPARSSADAVAASLKPEAKIALGLRGK
jgi:hypothetical protein